MLLLPQIGKRNEGILLANLLQSSRSTLSRGSFLSFLAFKEGILSTPISVLGGWPTVSEGFLRHFWTPLTALRQKSRIMMLRHGTMRPSCLSDRLPLTSHKRRCRGNFPEKT